MAAAATTKESKPHPEERRVFAARLEGWPLARPCPWPSFVLREPQDGRPRGRPPHDAVSGGVASLFQLRLQDANLYGGDIRCRMPGSSTRPIGWRGSPSMA